MGVERVNAQFRNYDDILINSHRLYYPNLNPIEVLCRAVILSPIAFLMLQDGFPNPTASRSSIEEFRRAKSYLQCQ